MKPTEVIDLSNRCGHVTEDMPDHVHRPAAGCPECIAVGSSWVHLRICLTCKHVGCCDASPNKQPPSTTRPPSIP